MELVFPFTVKVGLFLTKICVYNYILCEISFNNLQIDLGKNL
jgi:hypothetical protein